MNLLHLTETPSTTRAAEGFPRRAFTVDEILRMQEAGIIGDEENFELVEGEIVPMGPKYAAHERLKSLVGMALGRACPDDLIVGFASSLFLSSTTFVEPDICLHARHIPSDQVKGPDVVLAVEVAASSLALDLGVKAALYAKYGVRELWVIDANKRETHVHRDPVEGQWTTIEVYDADHVLTHPSEPGVSVRLAEL